MLALSSSFTNLTTKALYYNRVDEPMLLSATIAVVMLTAILRLPPLPSSWKHIPWKPLVAAGSLDMLNSLGRDYALLHISATFYRLVQGSLRIALVAGARRVFFGARFSTAQRLGLLLFILSFACLGVNAGHISVPGLLLCALAAFAGAGRLIAEEQVMRQEPMTPMLFMALQGVMQTGAWGVILLARYAAGTLDTEAIRRLADGYNWLVFAGY